MFPPGDQEKSLQNKENVRLAEELAQGSHAAGTLGTGTAATGDTADARRGPEALSWGLRGQLPAVPTVSGTAQLALPGRTERRQ